jgi:NAD+ synthase (glutamine-hydrolysing)
MKIALCQLNYHVGNFEINTQKIISALENAKCQGAELVVFAELAVCGYPPRDFLEFDDFLNRCEESIKEIASHCIGIAAVVGSPLRNKSGQGKSLFNAAYFLSEGNILHTASKALLPTYDIFDEYRYFEPGKHFSIIDWNGSKIALTICEDLWQTDRNQLYAVSPMEELAKLKPDLIVNIAASPFDYNHAKERKEILLWNANQYQLPVIYVNHIGAQTELIFDGGSLVVIPEIGVQLELPYFNESISIFDLTEELEVFQKRKVNHAEPESISLIHQALLLGINDYFQKLGFSKALLGLSGGVDSAVVATLAVQALGAENVLGVLMPSKFSSDHSIFDAQHLAKNLGIKQNIVPIEPGFETMLQTLGPIFGNLPFSLAEENLQSRLRGLILMAISNKLGGIVLNTSNKSESAVGYGTLYGDMNGGISVIGDLYKTQVYELAQFLNQHNELIPKNTILKPPSAELRPGQKDSDSLPDYEILDKILFLYIEKRHGPEEIIEGGYDPELVKRVLKMVNTNEYKRHQTPPILRVSPKAFGMGRRMPIVGKYLG